MKPASGVTVDRKCGWCNGKGISYQRREGSDRFVFMCVGKAWETERTRYLGGTTIACEPCRNCYGDGQLKMPAVQLDDGEVRAAFDWAYDIRNLKPWVENARANGWQGDAMRGVVTDYSGRGIGYRLYGYNREGVNFLRHLDKRLGGLR